MLCLTQVPGSEAEHENEGEEEEDDEEGSHLMSEQASQSQDVRSLHAGIPESGAQFFIKACDIW